jgi:hypothetical protein
MICVIVAFTVLGASRAPAGTLTLDFAIESLSVITGTTAPTTGSARVVLTGVDELGTIMANSARGSLDSFRFVLDVLVGDEMGRFEFRLDDPVSGGLQTALVDAVTGNLDAIAIRADSGEVVLTRACTGSAAVCAINPQVITLVGVSLSNLAMPGAARVGVSFSGDPFVLGLAIGPETARTFVPGSRNVPEPLAGALLLLGLSAHALRVTWRRRWGQGQGSV